MMTNEELGKVTKIKKAAYRLTEPPQTVGQGIEAVREYCAETVD